MASAPMPTTLTFTEMVALLEANPDETRRHELIDGVLYVTPSPFNRHQWVVMELTVALRDYALRSGGIALPGGGVYYDERNYVEPDVHYTGPGRRERVTERYTNGAPDLAIEVSSDATRRRDLTLKRSLYERTGVTEYWFVDLRRDCVLVHRRDPGFDAPRTLHPGDALTTPLLPGLSLPTADLLAPFPD